MAEILLDPDIRIWVFLPIVIITFLVGIIRHYVSLILQSDKVVDSKALQTSQTLMRSRILRENGKFIPAKAFHSRKTYFNDKDRGYFTLKQNSTETQQPKNPMSDPSMMTEMMKGNLTNMLPMIVIGGWINWAFSGFLTTKVPFPLTLRFKEMLQRGVALPSLDAAWVSSVSWYFLNVFGLRSVYTLILGQDNAADQTRAMQDQFTGNAAAMSQQDPNKAFKAEWEALEMCSYKWALEGADKELFLGQQKIVGTTTLQ